MTAHHKKTGHAARRSKIDIERLTLKLLRTYEIEAPPIPVRKIAQLKGIDVRFQPFSGSDVSAVLKRDNGQAVIGVNSAHSNNRQRFSIAHELGHYYLHADDKLFVDFGTSIRKGKLHFRDNRSSLATDHEEIEANTFAAALLMPNNMIRTELSTLLDQCPDMDSETAIPRLSYKFRVSSAAMEFRLLNLGFLVKLDD